MRGEAHPEPATMVPDEPTSETIWQDAYRRERGALLAFLRRLVRDGGTAEDLLQETFVRAIRAGRASADPERLRSYLFTIARNLAADHFRRPRLLSLERPAAEGEEPTGFDPEDHAAESPEAGARRGELIRRVGTAFAALPDRYRIAFRLAAVEQRSYREIGETTGWTLDQVRVNVHRARRRLIEELGDQLA